LRIASELAAPVKGLAFALNNPAAATATATVMPRTANAFVISASSYPWLHRQPSSTAGRPKYRATAVDAQMPLLKLFDGLTGLAAGLASVAPRQHGFSLPR
jgi:hypothetical protein